MALATSRTRTIHQHRVNEGLVETRELVVATRERLNYSHAASAEIFAQLVGQGTVDLHGIKPSAIEGVEEPVFNQGVECGTVRKYSDTLAIFVLNGHRSQRYRQRVDNRYVDEAGNDVLTLDDIRKALNGGE